MKFIRTRYYLKNKQKRHTCFLNLKLNSHIGSCLFPTIFLHQKSKHCKKIKIKNKTKNKNKQKTEKNKIKAR